MILDARARRENKVKEFQCKKCEFKSSSDTLMKRHTKNTHESKTIFEEVTTNIRKRFTCKICQFKTTNENTLKAYKEKIHQNKNSGEKANSKRIHCDNCNKKFNKAETFERHMKIEHKANFQENNGRSSIMKENEVQSGAKSSRRKESPRIPIIDEE